VAIRCKGTRSAHASVQCIQNVQAYSVIAKYYASKFSIALAENLLALSKTYVCHINE